MGLHKIVRRFFLRFTAKAAAVNFEIVEIQNVNYNSSSSSLFQDELVQHYFVRGTIHLMKKSPCDLESCPLRGKGARKSTNLPSRKHTFVCRDCGLTIHSKCTELLESSKFFHCSPELYKLPEIFGSDLTTLVKATSGLNAKAKGSPVPPFVMSKCIEEIEERGLDSEGIFRVPGSQSVMMQIQMLLERERENADLSGYDVDSICGVLKLFLRLLPEPIISRDVFEKFFQDCCNSSAPCVMDANYAKGLMSSLPPAHQISLSYLLQHLGRVAEHKEVNKMSIYNLASVLPPSLIVPQEMSLMSLKIATDLVELLIRHCPPATCTL